MTSSTKLSLEIVTPDRPIVSELVDEVELPGSDGYFGVLPDHAPLIAKLQVGEMWYRIGDRKHFLAISFGFAEVLANQVTVLARIAERAEEIDVTRAEAAKLRAEERIATRQQDMDFERARVALMKSLVRLQVASRARTRG
jgi:F-type H+-transporting ATPase subunit epsilon